MTGLPGLDSLDVGGKTALVRADLNVPLGGGEVVDDYRIQTAVPTIEALRERGAAVVVCSHLGRPKGRDPDLVMDPVAARLGDVGGFPVQKIDAVFGGEAVEALAGLELGTVAVLENTRFEPGETQNAAEMADGLAALADVFVLDAFGSAHRAHASTVGIAERLPSAAGLLVEAEMAAFTSLLEGGERPYVVVLGGAKISDKLRLMRRLLDKVDMLLVGGGMCFTLLAAAGYRVGDSLVDEDLIDEVRDLMASPTGGKILLPRDVVAAEGFSPEAAFEVVPIRSIPRGRVGLDIGPETVAKFAGVIANAERLFWNGPMGVYEWPSYRAGTAGVADAVAGCRGFSVVGGGDSVAALRDLGLDGKVSHVSTGGGAGLALLEGRELPAIEALRRWSSA